MTLDEVEALPRRGRGARGPRVLLHRRRAVPEPGDGGDPRGDAARRAGDVLTNGLLLDPAPLRPPDGAGRRLRATRSTCASRSTATTPRRNDPIRGAGTFERILAGVRNLAAAGLNPVHHRHRGLPRGRDRRGQGAVLRAARASLGIERPRLKILPVFQIGAEAERAGAYESWQRLRAGRGPGRGLGPPPVQRLPHGDRPGRLGLPDPGQRAGGARWARRWPTPSARFPLEHPACWTCHVYGVSCKT